MISISGSLILDKAKMETKITIKIIKAYSTKPCPFSVILHDNEFVFMITPLIALLK